MVEECLDAGHQVQHPLEPLLRKLIKGFVDEDDLYNKLLGLFKARLPDILPFEAVLFFEIPSFPFPSLPLLFHIARSLAGGRVGGWGLIAV